MQPRAFDEVEVEIVTGSIVKVLPTLYVRALAVALNEGLSDLLSDQSKPSA